MDRRRIALELLLDNHEWAAAVPAAGKLPWPRLDGFLSLRIFLVLQGGVDVGRAVGVIAGNPEADDERLEELLIASGLDCPGRQQADSAHPHRIWRPASRPARRQAVNPLPDRRREFTHRRSICSPAACSSGPRPLRKLRWRKARSAATNSSPLPAAIPAFKAVNNALHAGSDPKHLKLASTIIFWREPAPLCPLTSESSLSRKRKPWWRFRGTVRYLRGCLETYAIEAAC